jgi:hypothetical protein
MPMKTLMSERYYPAIDYSPIRNGEDLAGFTFITISYVDSGFGKV